MSAREWLLDQPGPDRCGPSHLCDGMSGCVQGVVSVETPAGAYVTRLHECLRPHETRAVVLVSMTGDDARPLFTGRFVGRERVRPVGDDGAAVSRAIAEASRPV